MIEKVFTVKNRLGLHARPAALFVQTTNRFRSSVRVVANGEDEKEVIQALEQLFQDLFNEKD
jgi:phosphotransferase system HPr-like phosphotransfer protein